MRVLITAGPTYEPLDPVRFLGNHSTGKMGYALAEAFAETGAEVALISGPTSLPDPASSRILTTRVQTAAEMYAAAAAAARLADVWVFAAAVADYRPAEVATQKIKKSGERLTLELVKNVDIAFELGKIKRAEQFSVGFALETEDEQAHALGKLARKNFDLIVLNSLRDAGAGFRYDTNQVTLLEADGRVTAFGLKSKTSVALDIVGVVLDRLAARHV
ncbi:phosphopantothenoylcysteine decarboxylase domain-containing protein [Hymenobacter lapidiphilus]|uniref:Phosphopantothenoylcysteine decarboxylase n=1 Tax=Hymenobacter lapidiphilus TaxID=2608003 RepID=A0A7Y7PMM9_9BACT|nr:phosphopantothenoylcysteine decarboxylase [Hymenobacter lapidiphilus]NVO30545.1 phosphopantothenoylcysteine decarboxylase [Hymenobacter lapidiphilus]